MKTALRFWLIASLLLAGCTNALCVPAETGPRPSPVTLDFNFDWQFHLGDDVDPTQASGTPTWQAVRLPHDWSIGLGFTQEKTGCSTGFLPGGIGWYRKQFQVPADWRGERVVVVFDGIHRLSRVWLNGREIGGRPSGYVSFDLDLSPHLRFGGEPNTLLVRVDRSSYLDTRWYPGSGIYRHVRLVKTAPMHIPEWGVWVRTSEVTDAHAALTVITDLANSAGAAPTAVEVAIELLDPTGKVVAKAKQGVTVTGSAQAIIPFTLDGPRRWSLETPHLYPARVRLEGSGRLLDERTVTFGLRTARFDAQRGFFLNDRPVKIKGVNLHHDAGLVGAAVPKDVWRDRLLRLQSIGVNAVRLSHNPHSPELLDLCDELGVLLMDEFFDEWHVAKEKSLVWLSDNKAPKDVSHGYAELFTQWAERDLKATIRRDRNHPSVILWSIGNEIEWTFPYYPKSATTTFDAVNDDYYKKAPDYDPVKIRARMAELHPGPDELADTARKLAAWVRETDPTRPITAGLVQPSVGFASGYAAALDVVGFNYRAYEYDPAHAMYPDAPILGSENWGTWPEWEAVLTRDFVPGIFVWTGYAYLGEAGPWPRKGLEISFFDFAGIKTPRGHFFEALWQPKPKVWLGATATRDSEYSFDPAKGWKFTPRTYNPPGMQWLRRWEWDRVAASWDFPTGESTVVQAYSNCETVELFLNGRSLGRQTMTALPDRIAKWLVPFEPGALELVGANAGQRVATTSLRTHGAATALTLAADRATLPANRYDVARLDLQLLDAQGVPVVTADREVVFEITGPARLLGVDNGWESSVQPYQTDRLTTWQGRALLLLQATDQTGSVIVRAHSGGLRSAPVTLQIQPAKP